MSHLMEHLAETYKEYENISVREILAGGVGQDGVQKDLVYGCVGINLEGAPSVIFLVNWVPEGSLVRFFWVRF